MGEGEGEAVGGGGGGGGRAGGGRGCQRTNGAMRCHSQTISLLTQSLISCTRARERNNISSRFASEIDNISFFSSSSFLVFLIL